MLHSVSYDDIGEVSFQAESVSSNSSRQVLIQSEEH